MVSRIVRPLTEYVVSQNVCSLRQTGRLRDIIGAASGASALLLQGIRMPAYHDTPIHYARKYGYHCYTAGYSSKGSKFAGVLIALQIRKHRFGAHAVAYPNDKKLWGRALAVRSKRGADCTYTTACPPTLNAQQQVRPEAYQTFDWLRQFFRFLDVHVPFSALTLTEE